MQAASFQRFFQKHIWNNRASVVLENPNSGLAEMAAALYNESTAGVKVNSKTALSLSSVWRAINLVSDVLAMLPINVYQQNGAGKTQLNNHYLSYLLKVQPNKFYDAFTFKKGLVVNAMLFGNGYAKINRDPLTNKPTSYELLFGNQVDTAIIDGEKYHRIYGSTVNGTTDDVVHDSDMFHLMGMTSDGILGMDVINFHSENLGHSLAAQKFAAKFFANGAHVNHVLIHPESLSDNAQKRVKNSFKGKVQGMQNAHDVPLLDEGMKLQKIGLNPEEAQLKETRQFTVAEVSRITGVHPGLLFELERMIYNNIEHLNIEFVNYCLQPWATKIENQHRIKSFLESEKLTHYVKINLNSLLRGDTQTRKEYYESMLRHGVYNRDEIRAFEEMNPIPNKGGAKFTIEANMIDLEDLGKQINAKNENTGN